MRRTKRRRVVRVFTAARIAPAKRRCNLTSASVRLGVKNASRTRFSKCPFLFELIIKWFFVQSMSIEMIIPSLLMLALYPW